MLKRTLTTLALVAPQLLHADPISITTKLTNYCSADYESTQFYCGMERLDSNLDDLNNNGIFDVYEPGRTLRLTLSLPSPPPGFHYEASSTGILQIDAFGDLDSDPLLPENPAELQPSGYYDHEWMDVSMEGLSLGRIFDGTLDNDRFNIGVEQNWWPHGYDRGTLWGIHGPEIISGQAELLPSEINAALDNNEIIIEFALARSHNDLTGHSSFDDREEFIQLTLNFEAELVPGDTVSTSDQGERPDEEAETNLDSSGEEERSTDAQVELEEGSSVLSDANDRESSTTEQGGGSSSLLFGVILLAWQRRHVKRNHKPRSSFIPTQGSTTLSVQAAA